MKTGLKLLLTIGIIILAAVATPLRLFSGTSPGCGILPRHETRGNLTLVYPQVAGVEVQRDRINRTIAREIDDFTSSHDRPGHSGLAGYKVEFNKNNLLSVRLWQFFYIERAAHPMSYQRCFTFNANTGTPLQLADLFRPEQDYLPRLNQLAAQQLAQREVPLLRPYNGVAPGQEFYLTADALVLYYQLYEYTPYVYGFLELAIPYEQLAGLLRPEITAR